MHRTRRATSPLLPAILSSLVLAVAVAAALFDPTYATDEFERGFLAAVSAFLAAKTAFWAIMWWRARRRALMAQLRGFPVVQDPPGSDA